MKFAIALLALTSIITGCRPDDDDDDNGGGNTDPAPVCPGADEVRYVSEDPAQCQVIRYTCNEGEQHWSDPECGCGCEPADCPAESADLTYISDEPSRCAAIRFTCEPGFEPWFSDCGCGCERVDQAGESCGGIMGKTCDEGFFCAFPATTQCGSGDQMGTCAVRPDVCIMLYKPVCGCDGNTQSSACAAASAGVSVLHDGECSDSPIQQN